MCGGWDDVCQSVPLFGIHAITIALSLTTHSASDMFQWVASKAALKHGNTPPSGVLNVLYQTRFQLWLSRTFRIVKQKTAQRTAFRYAVMGGDL